MIAATLRYFAIALPLCLVAAASSAHDLSAENAAYIDQLTEPAALPFLYLGAKHMVTGLDHLLFLFGVIFFLYRANEVLLYVTVFTIGHSLTLILGVWNGWQVNEYLVDAIIGFSVAYKAFENLGGFKSFFGATPNTLTAVFIFGLCHGLGLATKLQGYVAQGEGLIINLLSFNLGVELGQIFALLALLTLLLKWRTTKNFYPQSVVANAVLLCAGFTLAGMQLSGFYFSRLA